MYEYLYPKAKRVATSLCAALLVAALTAGTARSQGNAQKETDDKKIEKTTTRTTALRARGVRTLDAINIEGEIAVPQVLFITSRDFRRYRDGLALKFHKNSRDVTRSLDLPARLRFVPRHEEEK